MGLIKLAVFIILIILLINHWDTVYTFFNNIIDWIVYWMKTIPAGPPTETMMP